MFGARTGGMTVLPLLPSARASGAAAAAMTVAVRAQNSSGNSMETAAYVRESKPHVQYQHTEPCKYSRWTAKECHEFMLSRPWARVNDFYSELVNGRYAISELFGAERRGFDNECQIEDASHEYEPQCASAKDGRWARVTFQIVVSYHGNSFEGWQKQPGLNTVQGLVETSLGQFVDEWKVEQLKDKGFPIEGMATVAGRTDKGVSALNQVCSFYTWRKDVKPNDISDAINTAAPGKLRAVSVYQVSRAFHPNFSAKWRRYLYIFPLSKEEEEGELIPNNHEDLQTNQKYGYLCEDGAQDMAAVDGEKKPTSFSVHRVNQLLQQLEGKMLSYRMFARDTKASRNEGPPTECFLYRARAAVATLPSSDLAHASKIMCVELVGNRFLRKMVRVLVATAIREAAAGAEEDILVKLMDATCRRATAPPAPPDGLCLFDVGYTDFDANRCFIRS